MKKYATITPSSYNRYLQMVKGGYSKAYVCRCLNVLPSTMADYDARQRGLPTSSEKRKLKAMKKAGDKQSFATKESGPKIEYSVIKRKQSYTFIVDGSLHAITFVDPYFKKNMNLYQNLVHREVYMMTMEEFSVINTNQTNSVKTSVKMMKGNLEIKDNSSCYYKGYKVSPTLLKMIEAASNKKSKNTDKRIIKFVDLLIKNPDPAVIEQLYDFMLHNDIEICPNGYVLAYKSVTRDFKDHHTKTFDNSVGKSPQMNRADVDPDPNKTCSRGLHVASLSYINEQYVNGVIIKCIVHPANFVSIPTDYKFAKARVCKYKVSGVLKK